MQAPVTIDGRTHHVLSYVRWVDLGVPRLVSGGGSMLGKYDRVLRGWEKMMILGARCELLV